MYRIFLLILLLSKQLIAQDVNIAVDPMISKCALTHLTNYLSKDEPKKILTNNNLRKMVGAFEHAKGDKIILLARLFDKNCLPISGANIQMWQKNANGYYQLEKYSILDAPKHPKYDINFAGSGSATSDNLGRFQFISVMPGGEDMPFLNVKIDIPGNKLFKTKIYLTHNNDKFLTATKFNKIDINIDEFDKIIQSELNDSQIYMIDITLDVQQKYKKY